MCKLSQYKEEVQFYVYFILYRSRAIQHASKRPVEDLQNYRKKASIVLSKSKSKSSRVCC